MPSNNEDQILLILGVIAKRAGYRGSSLTKLRLVKFLYLLDLFWSQAKDGETFTRWQWKFIYYGPYCRQSTNAIDRATQYGFLEAQSYESEYGDEDFRLFKPGYRIEDQEEDEVRRIFPLYVSTHLFADVDKWCDDTYGLLDYVYFRTGPMRRARPGDVLSFKEEVKIDYKDLRPIRLSPLSDSKKAALRGIIGRMKKDKDETTIAQTTKGQSRELYDDAYFEMLTALEEAETPVGISGTASVEESPN